MQFKGQEYKNQPSMW